jgi:RNA-directed DNA polymerase
MQKLELSKNKEEIIAMFSCMRNTKDLAELLEIKHTTLIYYAYRMPKDQQYTTFEIHKKSGGVREISAPHTSIKIIQRKLDRVFQTMYKPKMSTHGFVEKRSIVTNAIQHKAPKYILNIDLKDFFGTVNFGRVRGLLMAPPYNLPDAVATCITNLVCSANKLPQGAPTSPIISNMVAHQLDRRLQGYAESNRCTYTRYVDDITFSTKKSALPKALGTLNELKQFELSKRLITIVESSGFVINTNKTRLQTTQDRQSVTGIIVNNKKLNLQRTYIRQIRAMLHAWERYGYKMAETEFQNKWDRKTRNPNVGAPSFRLVLEGKLNFLSQVKGKEDGVHKRLYNWKRHLQLRDRYKSWKSTKAHKERGLDLEKIVKELFDIYGIEHKGAFVRRQGADQIDGAFKIDGIWYLLECKWKKTVNKAEVDSFMNNVQRTSAMSLGMFLSVNGVSRNTPGNIGAIHKNIFIMDGDELEALLENRKLDIKETLRKKIEMFATEAAYIYKIT